MFLLLMLSAFLFSRVYFFSCLFFSLRFIVLQHIHNAVLFFVIRFLVFFLLHLAKKTHLITRRVLCYPQLCKKGFLLKLLLVAFFFAFFFCGCLAKVFLRQRVKKNYCSSNTKVKCVCISIFSFLITQKVTVIHF